MKVIISVKEENTILEVIFQYAVMGKHKNEDKAMLTIQCMFFPLSSLLCLLVSILPFVSPLPRTIYQQEPTVDQDAKVLDAG